MSDFPHMDSGFHWSRGAAVLMALAAVVLSCSFGVAAQDAALRGSVGDSLGAALPDARILISLDHFCGDTRKIEDIILTAAHDGTFQVRLPGGLYDVLVSASQFSPTAKKVQIPSGQTTVLNFRLPLDPIIAQGPRCLRLWHGSTVQINPEISQSTTTLIAGRVRDGEVHLPPNGFITDAKTGAPVSGMTVECFADGQEKRIAKTTTDSNGRFSFPQLGAGRYYLQATKKGFHRVRTVITAKESSPYALALVAEPK